MNIRNSIGSIWRLWDLHIHTPASFHWKGSERFRDNDQTHNDSICSVIWEHLRNSECDVFATVDYWTFDGYEILSDYAQRYPHPDNPVLFPGIELRVEAPVDFRLNLQVLFSPLLAKSERSAFYDALKVLNIDRPPHRDCLTSLGEKLPGDKQKQLGLPINPSACDYYNVGVRAAEIVRGSLVDALKQIDQSQFVVVQPYDTNDGVSRLNWKDFTSHDCFFFQNADLFETRKPESICLFHNEVDESNKSFIEDFQLNLGGYPKPAICGSDAHTPKSYGAFPSGRKQWIKADATFAGLRQILREPSARTHQGTKEPRLVQRIKSHPTHFMRKISVAPVSKTKTSTWFDFCLELNPGFVVVVGDRGSGKTALVDMLALAANDHESEFDFLTKERFCKSISGHNPSVDYKVDLQWADGFSSELDSLASNVDSKAPIRARYLSQNFVDRLCNTVSDSENSQLEVKLHESMFRHIPIEDRRKTDSYYKLLEVLVRPHNEVLKDLRKKLSGEIDAFAELYRRLDSDNIDSLKNNYVLKRLELCSLKRPKKINKPSDSDDNPELVAIQNMVSRLKSKLERRNDEYAKRQQCIADIATVNDKTNQLRERLVRIKSQISEIDDDATELLEEIGIKFNEIAIVDIDTSPLSKTIQENDVKADRIRQTIVPGTGSLSKRIATIETKINDLTDKLSQPLNEYHAYREADKSWCSLRNEILGDEDAKGTLIQLRAEIKYLESLGKKDVIGCLDKIRQTSIEIAREMFKLKLIHESLHEPIRSKLHDEVEVPPINFHSRMSSENLSEEFFNHIHHAKTGTYYGTKDAYSNLQSIVSEHDLGTPEGVLELANDLWSSLELNKNNSNKEKVSSQLKNTTTIESVLKCIYGITWLKVKDILTLEGKELSLLSPGQKGTLLLTFYLLFDSETIPLIVDQPEHNLDNRSVFESLVPYFKKASTHRQVIVVTHNSNLALLCDADQVIHATYSATRTPRIQYESGAIESTQMNKHLVDVLEGTWPAFDERQKRYQRPIS